MSYDNFVSPKVYFLGATALNLDSLQEYLKDTGQLEFLEYVEEAKKEGLNDGEVLCSFYAKACYASLTIGKNKNISRTRNIEDNIKGILNSGHGCYDGETEVLTKGGWVKWADISGNETFVTLDEQHNVSLRQASNFIKQQYCGKMLHFSNRNVDLLVTPNHNMLVCPTTTEEGRKKENYQLLAANDLMKQSHAYLKSANFVSYNQEYNPCYQLLGFAIGDGSLKGNKVLQFRLRRKRKISYLYEICNKLKLSVTRDNDYYSVDISRINSEFFEAIYNNTKEKIIPHDLLFTSDEIHFSLFDGLINSDGGIGRNGSIVYDTTSNELAGQMQALCLLVGFAGNISQAECYKNKSFDDKPIYRVRILRGKTLKPEINLAKKGISEVKEIAWDDFVYCVEVPNNTLYVRRNGKPVWCGNSVIEHCNLNFMVTNCSRIFTHELVRHRAGTAFSQTSGRYVRSDRLDVIIDPILEPAYDLVEEARQYLESWYHRLEERMKIDEVKNFDIKKKMTSAMRRMLPNGQANEIGFSVNLRALRHTIEMRTSEHAEFEIRCVFEQIYKLVKSKYPVIFFDATEEMKEGFLEVKFDNKKV